MSTRSTIFISTDGMSMGRFVDDGNCGRSGAAAHSAQQPPPGPEQHASRGCGRACASAGAISL
jgi:hypothetical protein